MVQNNVLCAKKRNVLNTLGYSKGQSVHLQSGQSLCCSNTSYIDPAVLTALANLFGFTDWPRGYKTFFTLNSVEHEILNAHTYKNIKKFSFFQTQISRECYFSCS